MNIPTDREALKKGIYDGLYRLQKYNMLAKKPEDEQCFICGIKPVSLRNAIGELLEAETAKAYAKGAHQFLESQYGKRCPDYDENCFICQHWDAYDDWVKEKPPSMRG